MTRKSSSLNRIAELDKLFKHIYEDMVNEKLSEARFETLCDDYDREQTELRVKIEQLTKEIAEQKDQAKNVDRFIHHVKKYLHLDKLPHHSQRYGERGIRSYS